jgi:DNA-binding CsgD family transcriptional regulator
MTGLSRRVAASASACAAALGLDAAQQRRLHRAGLIHGIGRTSVPNTVWDASGPLGEADRERLRLVPYWTGRAAGRIGALRDEAEIASYVDERLDGSGAFRGVKAAAIATEARVLAVALQWELLRTERPGRPAFDDGEALALLRTEAAAGRLDGAAVEALGGRPSTPNAAPGTAPAPTAATLLSARELEVLRRIGLGDSNKEAARRLDISPSTVRAHLENVFRKLDCSTRAAATLKAMTLGLL